MSDLQALAKEFPDTLKILKPDFDSDNNESIIPIILHLEDLKAVPTGLRLRPSEQVYIRVPSNFFQPPQAEVTHNRFLGYPHVLQGRRLCIFLDPSREWEPHHGARGFMQRLWEWLADAAQGAFDSSKALYHAVGGVLHRTPDTPTIVYREHPPTRALSIGQLIERSPHRLDFSWQQSDATQKVPVLVLSSHMPVGAALNFSVLLEQIDDPNLHRAYVPAERTQKVAEAFFSSMLACASRNLHDTPQHFILAIPHPQGGPPHMLAGRLPNFYSNELRRIVKEHGSVRGLNAIDYDLNIPVEWCYLSDERPEVTTRRDHSRPVSWFQDKKILVWGCGGLGSWSAEIIARAGASEITLCDPSTITGGLLVRQNYLEEDIGRTKAEALTSRLKEIRDSLKVETLPGLLISAEFLEEFDLILDATISHSTTVYLDVLKGAEVNLPTVAQIATDARTGTLGVMHVSSSSSSATLELIDEATGRVVMEDARLESFHELWQEVRPGAELIPTRGCSVPTFHGSAADLAAVASTLMNLIGRHMQVGRNDVSGTYLIALPHAVSGPSYTFLPYENVAAQLKAYKS